MTAGRRGRKAGKESAGEERAWERQSAVMSLQVGVCLGDGTVILLRAQPTRESDSSSAPIVVHDIDLLGEALAHFQGTGAQ